MAYLQKKLNKDNAKYRKEWLDSPREDALELRFDKLMSSVERIYGSFSFEQKKRIRLLSDQRGFTPQTDYAERLARQAQFIAMARSVLADKATPAAAQASIAAFYAQLEKPSEHGLKRRQELAVLLASITQIATPEQRLNAKTSLLDYAATFEGLSRGR